MAKELKRVDWTKPVRFVRSGEVIDCMPVSASQPQPEHFGWIRGRYAGTLCDEYGRIYNAVDAGPVVENVPERPPLVIFDIVTECSTQKCCSFESAMNQMTRYPDKDVQFVSKITYRFNPARVEAEIVWQRESK